MRSVLLLLALALLVTLAACGGGTSEPDPSLPAALTVTPADGAPGALLALASPALSGKAEGALAVRIGGLDAPLRLSESGGAVTVVPLTAAGPAGDTPPAAPVTVELLSDGEVIAVAADAFTVQAVTPAPAAADSLAASLRALTGSLRGIMAAFEPEPSETAGYAHAVLAACDTLLAGAGEGSLRGALAQLAADDAAAKDLIDAFIASSGMLESTRRLAAALGQVTWEQEKSGPLAAPLDAGDIPISDVALARKLQFQVLAGLFGQTVVNETAEEYALTVGLASGAIGLVRGVPGSAVISAIVSVADFAVNKILLGLLPSEVTSFTLTLEDADLLLGETTTARLDLTARNAPPPVGIQDFVGLTLNLLGLGDTPSETFRDILLNTANFFLGTIQAGVASYANAHPELNLDVSFALVPQRTWAAVIHDPRLVDLETFTPAIITGLDTEVDWVASGPSIGEGRIYARTATDVESVLIEPLPGFTYAGGAFGENVRSTETVSVQVTSTLYLEVDFAPVIAESGFNVLGVQAGYVDVNGSREGVAGLDVALIVDGGTLERSAGVTDADGDFITTASLSPGSQRILITVTVSDGTGQQLVRTVQADLASGAPVFLFEGGAIEADASASGCNTFEYDDEVQSQEISEPGSFALDAGAGVSMSCNAEPSSTSAAGGTSAISCDVSVDPVSGVVVITATAQAQFSANVSGPYTSNGASGHASASVVLDFRLDDADDKTVSYDYEFTASASASASGEFTTTLGSATLYEDGVILVYAGASFYNGSTTTPTSVSRQESGVLSAGRYTFRADASAGGAAFASLPAASGDGATTYTLRLTPR
ncbi:MAG TPA: hypothetical protein P5571_14235 [Candidatus Krumholzibacteria bacterium]|nr:hypothetical protein [Candidatus Krumholzibacteria bacterium]HRX52526.1 hypothetical protein [Candidatus Krumholzibacteria bacterium]